MPHPSVVLSRSCTRMVRLSPIQRWFSKFLGLQLFGTLMPIAMAVSCLAALSLMPVLVLRTRPAFVFGRAAKEAAGRGTPPRAAAGR